MYGGSGDAIAIQEEAHFDARDRSLSRNEDALLVARLAAAHKDLRQIEDEMLPSRFARIGETSENWELLVARLDKAWADVRELESELATARVNGS